MFIRSWIGWESSRISLSIFDNVTFDIKYLDIILLSIVFSKHPNHPWGFVETTEDSHSLCTTHTSYAVTSTQGTNVPKFPFFKAESVDLFSTPFVQDIGACCVHVDKESTFLKYQPPRPNEGLVPRDQYGTWHVTDLLKPSWRHWTRFNTRYHVPC